MKKRLLAVGALTLVVGACTALGLAGCSDKDDGGKGNGDNAPKITEGVYDGTYTAGGYKQENYIRFHEEGAVYAGKKTFYYHVYSGAMAQVGPLLGTYTVLDEQITVKSFPDGSHRDDKVDEIIDRTADKTVVCYSLDGNTEYFRTGWDTTENKLLGIPFKNDGYGVTATNNMGVGSFYSNYCLLNTTVAKEDKGVITNTFYCNVGDVKNASITLYHNGTYDDDKVTGSSKISGTYTVSGSTYTLTAGTGATGGSLVVNATGATFTPTGASEITMTNERQRTAQYTFTGKGKPSSLDNETTVTVILYDDDTVSVAGIQSKALEGTWEKLSDTLFNITIGTEETAVEYNETSKCFELTMAGVLCKTEPVEPAEATYLYSFTGELYGMNFELKLYDDNTCEYIVSGGQAPAPTTLAEGTYTANGTGGTVDTITLTGYDAVNVTAVWAEMKLTVTMPTINQMAPTLTYNLPTGA